MSDSAGNPFAEVTLEQLRRRTSIKWRTHPDDVLPLWVAEIDIAQAPAVVDALTEAISLGDTGYAAGTRYAEALHGFAQRRWGWDGVAVERSAVVPDVMLGIVEVLRLVTAPGDSVIVNNPVYPPFYAFVGHDSRTILEASLNADLRIDLDALEAAFETAVGRGRNAAYLLCNPHNPTGTVHTRQELTAVAQLARKHGVRVIADEIHAPVVLNGANFVPYLSVDGTENAFSLMSATKGWNLAGLKAALVIAGTEAQADLRRMPEEVGHGPSHLGVIAHSAALEDTSDWLDSMLNGLTENRRLLGELLAQHLPSVRYTEPEGTYLAWIDCRPLGFEGGNTFREPGAVTELDGPAALFLDRARVALSSGHVFGTGGAGHVRLNFACSPDTLRTAVQRMGEAAKA